MDLSQYVNTVNLVKRTELEKVRLIAFYLYITKGTTIFSLDTVLQSLKEIGHPISNVSRLKTYLLKSKDFKKNDRENEYMLTPVANQKLQAEVGDKFKNIEDIVSSSEVLDESLFLGKRGFIDKLVKQINNCYNNNCYDACAVLMRRVFEITLILAYEKNGVQDEIKDSNGDYVLLERIVANAIQNKSLHISRSRKEYDTIRELGNFAAHKIYYNTRKSDIDEIKQIYRVCFEELFYISGLKI